MSSVNPYAPPRANVRDVEGVDAYQPVRVFSATGRIGRLRYIGYSLLAYLIFVIVVGVVAGIASAIGSMTSYFVFFAVGFVVYLVAICLLTIQRCHDMDWSGWFSFLMLVPLVNFLFWFVSGTRGVNRFGAPPPPNKSGAAIIIAIVVGVFLIGVLAAIAIPQYQRYVERAKAAAEAQ